MKGLIKATFINFLAMYFVSQLHLGFNISGGAPTLISASVALTLLNRLVKPIIKLFLLPINVLTLGIFRWFAGVATLFILVALIDQIQVIPFYFQGFSAQGFVIPSLQINLIFSYIITTTLIRLASDIFRWLTTA